MIVDDVSTSYLFVGTPELGLLRGLGIAAVHSTPLISHSGNLGGVVSTHFHEPQPENSYDPAPLDRLAVQLADRLEDLANSEVSPNEEYDTLLPFICDGINCGQRAFHVVPSQHREDHLEERIILSGCAARASTCGDGNSWKRLN